jgi:hypothetical protein
VARHRAASRLCRITSALEDDFFVGTSGRIAATTTANRAVVTQPAVFNHIAVCLGSAWELPVVVHAVRLLARHRRSEVQVIHVAINPLTACRIGKRCEPTSEWRANRARL